jgi:hypothetical protein
LRSLDLHSLMLHTLGSNRRDSDRIQAKEEQEQNIQIGSVPHITASIIKIGTPSPFLSWLFNNDVSIKDYVASVMGLLINVRRLVG